MKMEIYMKRVFVFCFYVLCGGIFFAILLLSMQSYFFFRLHWLIILVGACFLAAIVGSYFLCSSLEQLEDKIRCTKIVYSFVLGLYIAFILFIGIVIHYHANVSSDNSIQKTFLFSVNVVPFATIYQYIIGVFNHTLNISYIVRVTLGNLLLFAPLGIILPQVFNACDKIHRFILIFLSLRIAFEIIQFILKVGVCNIDDVLLSLLGAILFYNVYHISFVQSLIKRVFY